MLEILLIILLVPVALYVSAWAAVTLFWGAAYALTVLVTAPVRWLFAKDRHRVVELR